MSAAGNFNGVGRVFKREAVALRRHLKRKTERLSSKLRLAPGHAPAARNSTANRFDGESLRETVRLAQQGDSAAFETIYQVYAKRVYAICLRMLHDPTEAEDAVQDAFLQLFRKIQTFRGESAFSTWLHRLAVNLVLMRLRKKSPLTVSIDATTDLDDETSSPNIDLGAPDLLLEGSVDRMNLERCIGRLPAGYRAIFVLHDIQGYQHDEIAEIVGCSVGNSKSQLHKARVRLRELLHEVQREKARDERLAGRKQGSRFRTALLLLAADNG
jgi:RNA polymerase sigma-70 factor, ECF subfamily